MNKTDVFFISASMFAAWACFVLMAPIIITVPVYTIMAGAWVGISIGRFAGRKLHGSDKEHINALYETLDEYVKVTESYAQYNNLLQAKIDALMLEYCPEEMSASQLANYELNVKAASQQQEEEVERALKH